MAISNNTTLNDLVGQIVSADAQSAAYSARVMRQIVRAVMLPAGAASIVVPRFQAITIGSLTQGTAPTAEAITSDGVTLTPVERGALVQISKSTLHADPFADLSPYGEQLGRALAQDEDEMIIASISPTAVVNDQSSGASNVTVTDLLAGIALLEAQNAPGPYFAVFHPTSWSKLRADLDDAGTYSSVGEKIVTGFGEGLTNLNGYVGSPYGIPCFISTKITKIDGDATYKNLLFSREAAGYAYTQDIGVDVDNNVPARAFDLMAWYAGDAAQLVDAYGVCIEDDVDG